MARIPEFFAREELRPDNMGSQALQQEGYHAERTAEMVPRNIREGVAGVQRGLAMMDEHQAQAQTASLMNDMSALTVQAHQDLQTTLNSADPASSTNPMDGFSENLQAKLDALGDKYDNPRTQMVYQRMKAELQTSLEDRGATQWAAQVKQYSARSLQTTGQQFANAATLDPASVDAIATQFNSAMDGMAAAHPNGLSKDESNIVRRAGMESIYNSAGMSIVHSIMSNPNASLQDIATVKSILGGDNFRNNMSPADYSRIMDDLDRAHTTRQDAASIYIEKSTPDLLKQVEKFGDPDGKIGKTLSAVVENTPAQVAAAAHRGDLYKAAVAAHNVTKQIGDMPEPQVQEYLQGLKQNWQQAGSPGDVTASGTAYTTAVKVAKQRDEEFHKSPATYMLDNNDTVGALYAKYQNDPTPQNFQTYAVFSSSQQEKLYPGTTPMVLSDDMKRQIGGQMQAIQDTPQGALQAAQVLSNLRTTTGSFYMGAVHELMKDKIIKPSQYVAGVLINRPESQMLAQEVLQAASVPKDTMEKTSPLDEVRAVAMARAAFAPLASTLHGTVNGDDLLNSYISATAAVLRQRATYGGTQYLGAFSNGSYSGPVERDATALANQMVLGRYNIANGMRIPQGFDKDDVVGGAQSVLGDLGNHKLVASPYYGGLINGGQQFAKDVASDGYWVTNPKGDGAILYFQGAPVQEHNAKGIVTPVQLSFSSLAQLGQQNRSPINKVERFFTNPGSL